MWKKNSANQLQIRHKHLTAATVLGNHSSSVLSSLTASAPEKSKWNSHRSAIEWGAFKETLIRDFIAEGCWDLVNPEIVLPPNQDEVIFNEPEINVDAEVNQILQTRIQRAQTARADRLAIINAAVGIQANARAAKILESDLKHQEDLRIIQDQRELLVKELTNRNEGIKKRKILHTEKQEKSVKVYNESISSDVLHGFSADLRNMRLRKVFRELNHLNSNLNGGHQLLNTLQQQINLLEYSVELSMTQNLIALESLLNTLSELPGGNISDELKVTYLMNFINRGKAYWKLKNVFEIHSGWTYNQFKLELETKYSLYLAAGELREAGKSHKRGTEAVDESAHIAQKKKQREDEKSKSRNQCKICHKNHQGKCMYFGKPCHTCGKIGHFANKCPGKEKGGSSGSKQEEPVEILSDETSKEWITITEEMCKQFEELCQQAELNVEGKIKSLTIVDSGATKHMFRKAEMLSNIVNSSGRVRLGKRDYTVPIRGVGWHHLLGEVLFVPDLSVSLISVPQIDANGGSVIFKDGKATAFDKQGQLMFTGSLNKESKLYIVDENHLTLFESSMSASFVRGSGAPRRANATVGLNKLETLHYRLGHQPDYKIKMLLKNDLVKGAQVTYDEVKDLVSELCEPCLLGKMKAFSSVKQEDSNISSLGPFEKVGWDYKGPIRVKTPHKENGFILFYDYGTGFMTPYLVKTKAQALDCIKDFEARVVKLSGYEMKVFQVDGDSVIQTKSVDDWLADKQILLYTSAPHCHYQNGGVERGMQTLIDLARTIMAAYIVPETYWGYAILYAAYTINRTKINKYTGVTPFQSIFKISPDVSYFVPFYAPGVYHKTKEERKFGTFSYKGEPCRMLGYADGYKNTYVVLNVLSGSILFRKDVVFNESLYARLREANSREKSDEELMNELDSLFPEKNDNIGTVTDAKIAACTESGMLSDESYRDYEIVHNGDYVDIILLDDGSESEDWILLNSSEDLFANIAAKSELKLPESPKEFKEALNGKDGDLWFNAIMKELTQLENFQVIEIAEEQYGPGMKTKIVLRISFDQGFKLKYKARFVCCGYSQVKYRDYLETFAPTLEPLVVFLLLHLAGSMSLYAASFDVTGAFLLADSDYTTYAWLPKDLFGEAIRVKVLKAWYGMKQAPKLWNDLFRKHMGEMGFKCCFNCPCLFLKRFSDGSFIIIAIFVDDGLIFSSTQEIINEFIKDLLFRVPSITFVQPLVRFIGMNLELNKESNHVYVDQTHYIENDLIKDFNSNELKDVCTPLDPAVRLTEEEPNSANPSLLPILGKVRFVVDRTRKSCLGATGHVTVGGTADPSDAHVKAANRLVSYLHKTSEMRVKLGGKDKPKLFAMSDANFKGSKSRIGGAIWFGTNAGAIDAFSKMASTVVLSSCHGEIIALVELLKRIIYVVYVLEFLGLKPEEPIVICIDNRSAIDICTTLKGNYKNSVISRGIEFVRECLNRKLIILRFVRTHLNVADVLTKGLVQERHEAHEYKIQYGFDGISLDEYLSESILSDVLFSAADIEDNEEIIGDTEHLFVMFADVLC